MEGADTGLLATIELPSPDFVLSTAARELFTQGSTPEAEHAVSQLFSLARGGELPESPLAQFLQAGLQLCDIGDELRDAGDALRVEDLADLVKLCGPDIQRALEQQRAPPLPDESLSMFNALARRYQDTARASPVRPPGPSSFPRRMTHDWPSNWQTPLAPPPGPSEGTSHPMRAKESEKKANVVNEKTPFTMPLMPETPELAELPAERAPSPLRQPSAAVTSTGFSISFPGRNHTRVSELVSSRPDEPTIQFTRTIMLNLSIPIILGLVFLGIWAGIGVGIWKLIASDLPQATKLGVGLGAIGGTLMIVGGAIALSCYGQTKRMWTRSWHGGTMDVEGSRGPMIAPQPAFGVNAPRFGTTGESLFELSPAPLPQDISVLSTPTLQTLEHARARPWSRRSELVGTSVHSPPPIVVRPEPE